MSNPAEFAPPPDGRRSERGQALLVVPTLLLATMVAAVGAVALGVVAVTAADAQNAADLSALAAVSHDRAEVEALTAENGAELRGLQRGADGTVVVTVQRGILERSAAATSR